MFRLGLCWQETGKAKGSWTAGMGKECLFVCLYARHRTANLNYKRKEGPATKGQLQQARHSPHNPGQVRR